MARRRLPYGTAATLESVVLFDAEIATDVTEKRLRVGDGVTPGGVATARLDEVESVEGRLAAFKGDTEERFTQTQVRIDGLAASVVMGLRGYALVADLPVLAAGDAGALAKVEATGLVYRWSGNSWEPFDDPTLAAGAAAQAAAVVAQQAADDAQAVGAGVDGLLGARIAPQLVNGAVSVWRDGRPIGLSIPPTRTGQNALVQVVTALTTPETWRDAVVEARMLFDVSPGYTPALMFGVPADTAEGEDSKFVTLVSDVTVSGRRTVVLRFGTDGDEAALKPYFLINEATTSVSAREIVLRALVYQVVSAPTGALSLGDRNIRASTAREQDLIGGMVELRPAVFGRIRPDGLGQFTSPAAAMASIDYAAPANRVHLTLDTGYYLGELTQKPYVDLVGRGRLSVMHTDPTDPHNPSIVQDTETLWMQGSGLLHGMKVTSTGRYPVHVESANGVKDGLTRISLCDINHLGLVDPSTWGSPHAVGIGMSSGQTLDIEGSTLSAAMPGLPIFVHSNQGFDRPCLVRLRNNTIVQRTLGSNDAIGIMIQPLGSGQKDAFEITGVESGGDLYYDCQEWHPTSIYDQPADRCEIEVFGHSNRPMVFKIASNARALRIESANTTSGAVAVAGSAAEALFGDVDTRSAGGGLPGFAMGTFNVSGQPMDATRLGARLGDCTTTAKTLIVTVDGGPSVTVTFSANHTAQSNAVVLGLINAVLGATGAASLYDVSGRYRPRFSDEEETLLNATATGIPMGSVVAFDGHDRKVRLMTDADDKSLFAGVAWEDIYPGDVGRVKTRGKLWSPDLRRADGAALTFGATFSIHPSAPGAVIVGGSQGLMMAIRADAVQVAR
ncbi:hypothetical protein ACFPIF_19390 [Brevundimonas faecalis]|uniref:hypothetical protein n=1 Tax=Brevundimonas faecalis TaxID=947378 RepID=UPI003616D45C